MPNRRPRSQRNRSCARATSVAALAALLLAGPLANSAQAAVVVPLGSASAFSVLAGSTVTNTGTTVIERNVGVSPGTAITGAGTMVVGPPGAYHSAGVVAAQAQLDLTTAHNNAAGQGPTTAMPPDMVGMRLVGGVYNRAAAMGLTGALTLDGENDPTKVWVFQAGTTLITGSGASVRLIRGANPCNVFWQVGSSATLGTTTRFVGTIMADQTITMNNAATLRGRALAAIGAVNLHNNVITTDDCNGDVVVPPGTTTPPTTGGTGGTGGDTEGENGGTGNAGNGVTPTGGNQVTRIPAGAVDTGYAGPTQPLDGVLVSGVAAVAFLAGLALVAVRRRGRT